MSAALCAAGFSPALSGWTRVDLDEVNGRAALLNRAEHKYPTSSTVAMAALERLRDSFDVLEIGDRAVFTYETVYFDTDSLRAYRQHVQGKRRRFKIRSRLYVESDLYFFEVKLKGERGRTIKHRMPYDADRHGTVGPDAAEFARQCLEQTYGEGLGEPLAPRLSMRFHRMTLVGRGAPERVTIDYDLQFRRADGVVVCAPDDTVIVEVKSEHGRGVADRQLRRGGARPAACSKYCVGLNLVRTDLAYNRFKPVLVRHFAWPGAAVGSPQASQA